MSISRVRLISRVVILMMLLNVVISVYLPGLTWAMGQNIPQTALVKPQLTLPLKLDSSASPWAAPHIQQAYIYGLTYPDIMKDFKKPITREEFCTIVVRLYEKLSNQKAAAGKSPFTDTANPEIVKAYQLGIVKGTGAGRFSPKARVTRQEICVMIFNCLEKAVVKLDKSTEGEFPFADKDRISQWALNAVKFAYKNGIMSGVGNNKIDPTSNTTREQAITLIKKTYEAFRVSVINATALIGRPGFPLSSEKEKFIEIDPKNRLAFPAYDTRLELFAATDAGKPAQLVKSYSIGGGSLLPLRPEVIIGPDVPTIPDTQLKPPGTWLLPRPKGPVYSNANYAAFIDQNGDKKRWFAFNLKGTRAANVIWQVSKVPFNGFKDNWKNPPGLLSTGKVPAGAGEFIIDFATFASGQGIRRLLPGKSSYTEIPKNQRKFFVRAVPVDTLGNCIGDPGEGITVLYGKPMNLPYTQNQGDSFQLWSPLKSGAPNGGGPENIGSTGEFPNKMVHLPLERYYNSASTLPHWFMFYGFDPSTTRMVIQVSTEKFSDDSANWDSPKGLVYSKSYDKLPVSLTSLTNSVPIVFSSFGPSKSLMKADEYIPFYVRAVAIRPSNVPGSLEPAFSEMITVKYGFASVQKILSPQNVTVKSYIPEVKALHYEPIRWENPNWTHQYVVFRAPKWHEINCSFKNVESGFVLRPYFNHVFQDPTMTPDRYESEIIPKVLKSGTKVTIIDREEDKSWWEEFWDDIVEFFTSTFNIIKNLSNWVSSQYASLKNGLIKFVAENFPGIPSDWRDGLRIALEALVNGGLAALGIPPSLPNFDQLTSMSLDYMAEVALAEAGIPSNQITKELLKETAEGIGNEISKAASSSNPNPLNSPFLKNDPDYLYRPAYVDVMVSNKYTKPTLPGSINIDVEWEWKENVSLDHEVWAQLPTNQQYADALQYMMHFVYGLSKGHKGYPIYYPVYEPVRGQPIPSLQPGEHRVVRIYLKEYVGKPYPFSVNGETVQWEDFAHLYWGDLGKLKFRVGTENYNLPNPVDAAKAQGFVPDGNHYYTFNYDRLSSGTYFEQVPSQAY